MGRFVVSSTGRSGTHRIGKLLRLCGIACGHEDIFTHTWTLQYVRGEVPFQLPEWPSSLSGDASRYSPPIVKDLPQDVLVLHQVRHPVDTIKSFLTLKWLDKHVESEQGYMLYHKFIEDTGTTFQKLCQFWLNCNKAIEVAALLRPSMYFRYRLEDLSLSNQDKGISLLEGITQRISKTHTVSKGRAEFALKMVPENYHHRPYARKKPFLVWHQLPLDVRELATSYGYAA